jgi:hypothetical protein
MKKIFFLLSVLPIMLIAQNTDSVTDAKLNKALAAMRGGSPDPNSLALLHEYANNGDAKAMNALGIQFKNGVGVTADNKQAFYWFEKAADNGYSKGWYNKGLAYKYGMGVPMDYSKAYNCFLTAANLNDPSGWYATGYMLYKGEGCSQNYTQAIAWFRKGAYANKANSMYFYGLSWRNGYGTDLNKDSAVFWLTKASELGYSLADVELKAPEPENSDIATDLLERIKAANAVMDKHTNRVVNQYAKVENNVPADQITGAYGGYLIQYDWSGKHVVKASKLGITLIYDGKFLKGQWIEDDTLIMPIHASLTPKSLVFGNMQYNRKDHYSLAKPDIMTFRDATLQLSHSGDTVYLSGNLQMFSANRQEPGKPMCVALIRTSLISSDSSKHIEILGDDVSVRAYPNPFANNLTLDFQLQTGNKVVTQILTLDGKIVYNKPSVWLDAGHYTMPIQAGYLAPGTYFLRLQYGSQVKTTKLIKL